jgi:hypothetical protein
MVSKAIIAVIGVVSVIGILVVGGLVFFSMVRSSNDAKAQSCINEKQSLDQLKISLDSKVYVPNSAWYDFNVQTDNYNARCATPTNYAATGPQP